MGSLGNRKGRRRGRAVLVAALLVLAAASVALSSIALAAAPPLVREQSFGGGSGVASVGETIPGYRQAAAVKVAPDGGILVAGEESAAVGGAIVRFDGAGILDRAYGDGGYVALPGVSAIDTMALDSEGGAVVLSGRTTVTRVTAAGTIDTAFGEDGSVSLPALDPTFASLHFWSVAILPDGDVLVAGISFGSPRMVVLRLLPDGSLDRSFGEGGLATLGFGANPFAGATAMAVAKDGDILLAGYAHHDPAVGRLLPDGSPDPRFGSRGISAPRRFVGELTDLVTRPDGSVIAIGHGARRGGTYGALLLHFRRSGALDRSFGSAARPTPERGRAGEPIAVLPSHGRIFMLIKTYGPALRVFRPSGREGARLARVEGVPHAHFSGTAATLDHGDLILAWTPRRTPPAGGIQLERFRVRGPGLADREREP